tara:strand:+ start:126 stop:833 length:708 start_codon:yes stop_codon:yes gene_type:complete
MKQNNVLFKLDRLILMVVAVLAISIIACGSEQVAESPDPVATATLEQATSEPTATNSPTAEPTKPPTPTESSTATTISEPTPTPIRKTTIGDYGFSLDLDGEVAVQSQGWTGAEPDTSQGMIKFPYEGVSAILVWYSSDSTAQQIVADSYNLLKDSQPNLTFEGISDGAFPVSGETGVFGGFKVLDGGSTVGGGFVSGWVCPDSQSRYALTVTGPQATVVQIRFQRIVNQFSCSS